MRMQIADFGFKDAILEQPSEIRNPHSAIRNS